jgi:hypothetical protein
MPYSLHADATYKYINLSALPVLAGQDWDLQALAGQDSDYPVSDRHP